MAFDKIYQTVLTACRALPAPSPLGNLRLELKAWHGAADAQKLVEMLQATFSAADLLSAGVVRGSAAGDGEMVLHPDLADPQRVFFPLREAAKSGLSQLLGHEGCVNGDSLPLVAALKDFRNQAALERGLPLLVAFDPADCAILSALEFPATIAAGLDRLADPGR